MKGNDESVAGKDEKPAKKKAVGKRVPVAPARKGAGTRKTGRRKTQEEQPGKARAVTSTPTKKKKKAKGTGAVNRTRSVRTTLPKKMGRPAIYQDEFAEQAEKLCRLGAVDAEIADFFGVDERTINRWKIDHADFCQSLKRGKSVADMEVADRLYKRATGYSHPEVKTASFEGMITDTREFTKHYPPDTVACIFWLKNRRPDLWRDKVQAELSGPDGGPIQTVTPERSQEEAKAFAMMLAAADKKARPPEVESPGAAES